MDLNPQLETLLAIVGTLLTIILTLYKGVFKPMIKACKEKYISVKSFINDVSDCVQLVNKELKTNGGSSIKDAIFRIDNKINILDSKNKAYLSHIELPILELNPKGNLTWINRAGYRLFKRDFSDLKNLGWLGSVDPNDRDIVENELEDSSRQKRSFSIKFKLEVDNKYVNVIFEATPLFEENNFSGYFGVIRVVDNQYYCPFLVKKENENVKDDLGPH